MPIKSEISDKKLMFKSRKAQRIVWLRKSNTFSMNKALDKKKPELHIFMSINAVWGNTIQLGKKNGKGWEFIIILMDFLWLRKNHSLPLNFLMKSIKILDLKSASLAHRPTYNQFWKLKYYNLGMWKKPSREMLNMNLALW